MKIKINWDIVFDSLRWTLVEELSRRAPAHHGDLRRSIQSMIEDDKLTITAIGYARFVDEGRLPGKMPPVDALEKWAKDKLGNPDLKWALAYSIKKYGTKPSWFIRDTVEQELPRLLADALKEPGAVEVITQES
jgi:hypothetical protein